MLGKRNALVGQSGGPTAVINGSLYGVIKAVAESKEIDNILGAIHGIEGVLNEQFLDFSKEAQHKIEGLKYTPGAALGGCRYKLDYDHKENINKLFETFDRYNIGYFFYIGGNDSMDTAHKVHELAQGIGYDLKVIGIPKTIDNDLVLTHHCPGFGSCAKYVATSVREAGMHTASMYTSEPITVLETVGRNTGWLPAASALARRDETEAPHLLCLPEVPFDESKFLVDVENTYQRVGGVFIVVGEGLMDTNGNYVNVQLDTVAKDAFGHPLLGGSSQFLKNCIEKNLKIKTRYIKLDICQQSAMHFASQTDLEEAVRAGKAAVEAACKGKSGYMVSFTDYDEEGAMQTGLVNLQDVANEERKVPLSWLNKEKNYITEKLISYARPLIQGEVKVPMQNGLPDYVSFGK